MQKIKIRALYVEDEPVHGAGFADNLRFALRDQCALDVEFVPVESVEEAKNQLSVGQGEFPLVITDILFPQIGVQKGAKPGPRGLEVIRQARKTEDVVVVAISQGCTELPRLHDLAADAGAHVFRYKQEVTESARDGGSGWEDLAREICQAMGEKTNGEAELSEVQDPQSPDTARVMVVYGRRRRLVQDFFGFLRALGLDPLEWSKLTKETIAEVGEGGNPDVLDIVRTGFLRSHGCVVLFSPDDQARIHPSLVAEEDGESDVKLVGQPRQNVLLEAGYALGYKMERTLIVSVGAVRGMSDLAGRHVVRLSNSPASRKEVGQRLGALGFRVKMDGDDWLTIGNFDLPE